VVNSNVFTVVPNETDMQTNCSLNVCPSCLLVLSAGSHFQMLTE